MVEPQGQQAKENAGPVDASAIDKDTTPLSLLERAHDRDPKAWQRLVALYQPLVLFWCRRSGLHGPDAEDIVQEVFAGVAAGLGDFRRDRPGDTFRGWLCGITRNQMLLYFRRNQNRPQAEGGSDHWEQLKAVPDHLAQADADEAAEISALYRRAVEQVRAEFEPQTWQAFWLTAVEGRSPPSMEQETGMTAAAIRQAKSRVLRRLKQEMGELLN